MFNKKLVNFKSSVNLHGVTKSVVQNWQMPRKVCKMNTIQNYGMTNYQMGFQANKSKVTQQLVKDAIKEQPRYQELISRMNEINNIENNIIKERGFGYAKYYMEKFSPEVTKILAEMKQMENVVK